MWSSHRPSTRAHNTTRKGLVTMGAFLVLTLAWLVVYGGVRAKRHAKALMGWRFTNHQGIVETTTTTTTSSSAEKTKQSSVVVSAAANDNDDDTTTNPNNNLSTESIIEKQPQQPQIAQTQQEQDTMYKSLWSETTPWLFYNDTQTNDADEIQFSRFPQPKGPSQMKDSLNLRSHFCQGPLYDTLAQQLHDYSHQTELHGPTWGRRRRRRKPSGIPSHSTILAFGNSHTRQVALALAAQQMPTGIRQTTPIYSRYATRIDLQNNATMYLVTNSYAPFASDWQVALSNLTNGLTLLDFDAILVGNVNGCSRTTPEKAGSLDKFRADGIPNLNCDFVPPSLNDWMQAYFNNSSRSTGRLLFLTSFMKLTHRTDEMWARTVAKVRHEQDYGPQVGFIYGRHHVDTVGNEGADLRTSTERRPGDAACATCEPNGHRCIGRYGGHPDLVAFDVAEWLWTGMDSLNHSFAPRPFVQNLHLGL